MLLYFIYVSIYLLKNKNKICKHLQIHKVYKKKLQLIYN